MVKIWGEDGGYGDAGGDAGGYGDADGEDLLDLDWIFIGFIEKWNEKIKYRKMKWKDNVLIFDINLHGL